jgi:hypothetical protein
MKKAIVALITLLLLLSPSSLIAAQDDKQPGVEKPKTKYEVSQKLYKDITLRLQAIMCRLRIAM